MSETPKRSRRKRKAISETHNLYSPVYNENDVTYDYLPTANLQDVSWKSIPLGRRPEKFIKSPSIITQSANKRIYKVGQKNAPTEEDRLKCVQLLSEIFKKDGKENLSTQNTEQECVDMILHDHSITNRLSSDFEEAWSNVDCPTKLLLDDSSSNALYHLSQQVEEAVGVDESRNCNSPLLRDRRGCKSDKKLKNKSVKNSSINLLLEDGNDAGFFELDERILVNKSCIGTNCVPSQKCTPQEIEAKRREALKKLREKQMKAKKYNYRHTPKSCSK